MVELDVLKYLPSFPYWSHDNLRIQFLHYIVYGVVIIVENEAIFKMVGFEPRIRSDKKCSHFNSVDSRLICIIVMQIYAYVLFICSH